MKALEEEISKLNESLANSQSSMETAEKFKKQLEEKKKRDLENLKKQNEQVGVGGKNN